MRAIKRQFWLLVFFSSAVARLLFMAGKMYFSARQATEYLFRQANTLPGIIMMTVLIVSNLLTNLIAKVPAIHKYFLSEPEVTPPNEVKPLGWRGRVLETSLKTAGAGYGLIQVGAGYFSIALIVKTAAELMGKSLDELPLQEEIPLQVALIIAALLASDTYLGYDYPLIKKNARILAEAVDTNDFAADKTALLKTLLCSSLNLATFPALAYFYCKPTLTALPGSDKFLGEVGVNIGISIACLITLLTVITWLPSVYKHFSGSTESNAVVNSGNQRASIDCRKLLLRSVAYPAITIDSLGEGLALFIAVITTGTALFNSDEYGWMIAPAAIAGLNGFFINLLFATLPGVHKFETHLEKNREAAYRWRGDEESAPLLSENSEPIYGNPITAQMLTFSPSATQAQRMDLNVSDAERISSQVLS